MKRKLTFVIIYLLTFSLYSQDIKMCAYKDYLTENQIKEACGNNSYMSNIEAENVIDNILNNVGLFRNFIIKECPNISNAVAATVKSSLGSYERYIIYDKKFLNEVRGTTGTNWGSISILAHEIGHHLNGHTLTSNIENHQAELQADEFSGFVLSKMGATLNESLKAIEQFGSDYSSKSHPNKNLRIKAITKGWNKDKKSNLKLSESENIEIHNYDKEQYEYYFNKAKNNYNESNYNLAGKYFIEAFKFSSGRDKTCLYNSAVSYSVSKNYSLALKYYTVLLKNGINELDKEKQKEVYKNIAYLYIKDGKSNEALNFLKIARRENPDDLNMLLNEAQIYLKLGKREKFSNLLKEAAEMSPNNPVLFFNLGVINFENRNINQAINYYEKALKINPNYSDALLNISVTILSKEQEIVKKMNENLSNYQKYDELAKEQKAVYRKALPYLERLYKLDRTNQEIIRTLSNVYSTIGENGKARKMKKLMY